MINRLKHLRTRLFLVIMSVQCLTLLIVLPISASVVRYETEQAYQTAITHQIGQLDQAVDTYIKTVEAITLSAASLPIIQEADDRITSYVFKNDPSGLNPMRPLEGSAYEAEVYKVLKVFQESHRQILNVSLGVEINGGFVSYHPRDRFNGYDARQRDWYKMAVQTPDQAVYSDIYTTSAGEKVILCAKAVIDDQGNLKGVVSIDFDLQELSKAMGSLKIGQTGHVVILDPEDQIIAYDEHEEMIGKSLEVLGFSKKDEAGVWIASKVGQRLLTNAEGQRYWIATLLSKNNQMPLKYLVIVEEDSFFTTWWKIINTLIGPLFVVFLLTLLTVYWFARRLTKPIVKLTQYADDLASGQLNLRLELQRQDELGKLSRRLNLMAETLENGQKQLEYLVEERTSDLTAVNEELIAANEELESTLSLLQATQEQLIRSEKLSGLGTLISGVAHEINTPVGVAITSMSYAGERLRDMLDQFETGKLTRTEMKELMASLREAFELVNKSLERVDQLVKAFKMSASGEKAFEGLFALDEHNIRALIGQRVQDSKPHYDGLQLNWEPGIIIHKQVGAVLQIIEILLDNAFEHGYKNRNIGPVVVSLSRAGEKLRLRIKDFGVGISADAANHLFEPFYTTERVKGKMGLGLHTVYSLVTLTLGGTVTFISHPESGTEFIVEWTSLEE